MTQQLFINFIKKFVIDTDRKVPLIVDNLKVHHVKIAVEWSSEHKDEIELFFIPPYSPEINPAEYLNHNLKNIHSEIISHTKKQIQENVEKYMHHIQKFSEKVSCLFKHQNLKFIQYYNY